KPIFIEARSDIQLEQLLVALRIPEQPGGNSAQRIAALHHVPAGSVALLDGRARQRNVQHPAGVNQRGAIELPPIPHLPADVRVASWITIAAATARLASGSVTRSAAARAARNQAVPCAGPCSAIPSDSSMPTEAAAHAHTAQQIITVISSTPSSGGFALRASTS